MAIVPSSYFLQCILRRCYSLLTPQRVPGGPCHEQVQNHPKHVPRHARVLRPAIDPQKKCQHAAILLLDPVRARRCQFYAWQGQVMQHTASYVGWRHRVATCSEGLKRSPATLLWQFSHELSLPPPSHM